MLIVTAVLLALILVVLAPEHVGRSIGAGLAVAIGAVAVTMLSEDLTRSEALWACGIGLTVAALWRAIATRPRAWPRLARVGHWSAVGGTWFVAALLVLATFASFEQSGIREGVYGLVGATLFALMGVGLSRDLPAPPPKHRRDPKTGKFVKRGTPGAVPA